MTSREQLESAILEIRRLKAAILEKKDLDGVPELVRQFEDKVVEVDTLLKNKAERKACGDLGAKNHCIIKYRHIIHLQKHLKLLNAPFAVRMV